MIKHKIELQGNEEHLKEIETKLKGINPFNRMEEIFCFFNICPIPKEYENSFFKKRTWALNNIGALYVSSPIEIIYDKKRIIYSFFTEKKELKILALSLSLMIEKLNFNIDVVYIYENLTLLTQGQFRYRKGESGLGFDYRER